AVVHLDQKGRGRALKRAWLESQADAMCYMDVDLSTDLADITPLLRGVLEEGYDVAYGSLCGRREHRALAAPRDQFPRLHHADQGAVLDQVLRCAVRLQGDHACGGARAAAAGAGRRVVLRYGAAGDRGEGGVPAEGSARALGRGPRLAGEVPAGHHQNGVAA